MKKAHHCPWCPESKISRLRRNSIAAGFLSPRFKEPGLQFAESIHLVPPPAAPWCSKLCSVLCFSLVGLCALLVLETVLHLVLQFLVSASNKPAPRRPPFSKQETHSASRPVPCGLRFTLCSKLCPILCFSLSDCMFYATRNCPSLCFSFVAFCLSWCFSFCCPKTEEHTNNSPNWRTRKQQAGPAL